MPGARDPQRRGPGAALGARGLRRSRGQPARAGQRGRVAIGTLARGHQDRQLAPDTGHLARQISLRYRVPVARFTPIGCEGSRRSIAWTCTRASSSSEIWPAACACSASSSWSSASAADLVARRHAGRRSRLPGGLRRQPHRHPHARRDVPEHLLGPLPGLGCPALPGHPRPAGLCRHRRPRGRRETLELAGAPGPGHAVRHPPSFDAITGHLAASGTRQADQADD